MLKALNPKKIGNKSCFFCLQVQNLMESNISKIQRNPFWGMFLQDYKILLYQVAKGSSLFDNVVRQHRLKGYYKLFPASLEKDKGLDLNNVV